MQVRSGSHICQQLKVVFVAPSLIVVAEPDLDVFAESVREFFNSTLPAVLEGVSGRTARAKAYRAALFDAGLAGLDYPRAFGGQGLGAAHLGVFATESEGKVPSENSVFGIGVGMALPIVRDHCSDVVWNSFLCLHPS